MPSSPVYKPRGHNVARLAKKMHRFLKDGKVVIVDTNITSVVHVKVERTTKNGLESSAGHFDWPHPSIESTKLDECYTVDMSIGGQKVRLQLDTGSSDTWLRSSRCVGGTHKHIGHQSCYDPLNSKTYQALTNEPQFAITYEDDSQLTGKFISESIVNKDIHIPNQVIGLVDNVSHILLNDTTDGILALGWDHDQRLARKHSNTFVENLQPHKIFMIKLVEHHQQAECTFGYVPKAILSRVKYTDVVHQHDGLWMVASERTVINDVIIPGTEGNNAVVDTGSPLCRLEASVCRVIYANIEGAEYVKGEGWIFPRGAVLPRIKIAIGDHLFVIHKSDLGFCSASKEGYVYGGIQSRGELVFDLLGDTFLKGVFAVFDVENKRFGAVARQEGAESLVSGSRKRRRPNGDHGDRGVHRNDK